MSSPRVSDLTGLSILLVDDDARALQIVKALLEGFGIREVMEAHDAVEALEKLNGARYDLIIVDFMMKPLDGLDFIRLVRTAKDSANPRVPIILITAFPDERRVKEARDAGVNAFLCKPVTAAALHRHLLSVVQDRRSFVRADTYFGPCRRRRDAPPYKGPERRKKSVEDDGSAQR